MAWYVEHLLRHKLEIKTRADINADDFNDMLVVDKMVQTLYAGGLLTDEEINLCSYLEDGKPIVNSKEEMGKNRLSLAKDINSLTNKIAFYLGGYFTDDGFVSYVKEKYKLDNQQADKLIEYMKGRYKNKLIRRTNNE